MSLIDRRGEVIPPRTDAVLPEDSMEVVMNGLRGVGAKVTRHERSLSFEAGAPRRTHPTPLSGIVGGVVQWDTTGDRLIVRYTVRLGVIPVAVMCIGGILLVVFLFSLLFGEPAFVLAGAGIAALGIGWFQSLMGTDDFDHWLERTVTNSERGHGASRDSGHR